MGSATICHGSHRLLGTSSVQSYPRHRQTHHGFECRCAICVLQSNNIDRLRLKKVALNLWAEVKDFKNIEGLEVYRKAAYVLDGLALLEFDRRQVTDVEEPR